MPNPKYIEYKPPGATEWQRIEVVVDAVRSQVWAASTGSQEKESRPGEPASRETITIGVPELLAVLFGVSVLAAPPPVSSPRKSPSPGSIDRMIERFARQSAEARQPPGSRPATPSAGSRAEKLAELDRLLRESRLR